MERPITRPSSSSFKRSRRSTPPRSKSTSRLNSYSGPKQSKKVKFADLDDAPDVLSGHAKRTILNHGTGGAKTSELMFFQKLCGTAGQKGRLKPQSIQAQEPNKVRISLSDQAEKETPIGHTHLVSSHEKQLYEEPSCSGLFDTPIYKLHKKESSSYPVLAQELLLLSPEASRSLNPKCENGRVFSDKRSNLIKLAAKTLSVGVDDFIARRSDLIRELMQRLGIKQLPESKKNTSCSNLETPIERDSHFGDTLESNNSSHYATNLPALPSIEAGVQPNMGSHWSIEELENSEMHPDFDTGFAHDKSAHNSSNYLLPSSPYLDLVPYGCSFDGQVQDKSLVPYCFQSPVKKFNSELMSWDVKEREEKQSCLPLALCNPSCFQDQSLVPYSCFRSSVEKFNSELMSWDVKEREEKQSCLPLALCNPCCFYDEAEELGGDVFFGSPPRKKVSAIELHSSYVCEREDFSHISDADFSIANDRSLVLVNETSVNSVLGFGYDLPVLNLWSSFNGSNWCAQGRESSDLFLIDN